MGLGAAALACPLPTQPAGCCPQEEEDDGGLWYPLQPSCTGAAGLWDIPRELSAWLCSPYPKAGSGLPFPEPFFPMGADFTPCLSPASPKQVLPVVGTHGCYGFGQGHPSSLDRTMCERQCWHLVTAPRAGWVCSGVPFVWDPGERESIPRMGTRSVVPAVPPSLPSQPTLFHVWNMHGAIWDVLKQQLLTVGKADAAHILAGATNPAWRSPGVQEPPPFPDSGICFWDSSDTVRAVTERALLGGMRCRAHALVVAQGWVCA